MSKRAFSLHSVKFDTTVLDDHVSQRETMGYELDQEIAGGMVDLGFTGIMAGKPMVEFTTRQLASFLGLMDSGLSSLALGISGLSGGLLWYWAERAVEGKYKGSGSHLSTKAVAGLVCVKSITLENGKTAQVVYEVAPISADGQAHPFTLATSVTLPTQGAVDERFTLGPVKLANVTMDNLKKVTIEPNIEYAWDKSMDDVFYTFVSIKSRKPVIKFSGSELSNLGSNFGLAGTAGTQANTIFYARKRAANGKLVATGTSEHVKFAAAGMCVVTGRNASGVESGDMEIEMHVLNDGTHDILTIDTAAAIS